MAGGNEITNKVETEDPTNGPGGTGSAADSPMSFTCIMGDKTYTGTEEKTPEGVMTLWNDKMGPVHMRTAVEGETMDIPVLETTGTQMEAMRMKTADGRTIYGLAGEYEGKPVGFGLEDGKLTYKDGAFVEAKELPRGAKYDEIMAKIKSINFDPPCEKK